MRESISTVGSGCEPPAVTIRPSELVTEYLEGTLATEDRYRFDTHLLACEGCVAYLDQMRTAVELTGRLREDDVPRDVEERLLQAFRGWSASSPLR